VAAVRAMKSRRVSGISILKRQHGNAVSRTIPPERCGV